MVAIPCWSWFAVVFANNVGAAYVSTCLPDHDHACGVTPGKQQGSGVNEPLEGGGEIMFTKRIVAKVIDEDALTEDGFEEIGSVRPENQGKDEKKEEKKEETKVVRGQSEKTKVLGGTRDSKEEKEEKKEEEVLGKLLKQYGFDKDGKVKSVYVQKDRAT